MIKKVYQTRINTNNGNCIAACVASLCGLTLEEVPDFNPKSWSFEFRKFFEARGVIWLNLHFDTEQVSKFLKHNATLKQHCLLAVRSEAFPDSLHCVVGLIDCGDLSIVHDPNPNNKIKSIEEYEIFELDLFFQI